MKHVAGICCILLLAAAPAGAQSEGTRHDDGRPRLDFVAPPPGQTRGTTRSARPARDPEQAAREFIARETARYNVDPASLKLVAQSSSLRGTALTFQQTLNRLDVFSAQIRLTVDGDGLVSGPVFNNIEPIQSTRGPVAAEPRITSTDQVYDIAWRHIRASGALAGSPSVRLGYHPGEGGLRLAYEVVLSIDKPLGTWRCVVDANDGSMIDLRPVNARTGDIACINLMPPGAKRAWTEEESRVTGDRQQAFEAFRRSQEIEPPRGATRSAAPVQPERVTGSGLIFDPEPRTALGNTRLDHTATPEQLKSAYARRSLPGLIKRAQSVHLEGPWVRIVDFQAPNIAPATAPAEGRWEAQRDSAAFNDIMVYYHIDRSQRYLQSLGYRGTRGIQALPIEADANAVNGQDNSFYQPGSNRLAFGSASPGNCVADAEDADVILHEYGHAITWAIMRKADGLWTGGDSAAIGEGFGDYWAASSRWISSENGRRIDPFGVMKWDAACGNDPLRSPALRRLDAKAGVARYQPGCLYPDHAPFAVCKEGRRPIGGGYVSDELWSTPLFQSFVTLVRDHNRTRAEVDTIILEAMHALLPNFTMRDLAQLIVYEAGQQHPTGPHAQVFQASFRAFNILPEGPEVATGTAAPSNLADPARPVGAK